MNKGKIEELNYANGLDKFYYINGNCSSIDITVWLLDLEFNRDFLYINDEPRGYTGELSPFTVI